MTRGDAAQRDGPEECRLAPSPRRRPWRLGVLLSGSGRTLENLLAVIGRGELDAEIVAVVSSRDGVRGIEVARDAGLPVAAVPRRGHASSEAHSRAIYAFLEPHAPDLVIHAGFLRKLVVEPAWRDRMLNIHPCLLPQAQGWAAGRGFYGDAVHAAVLAHGDTETGATVHVVTDDYDDGPPVLQGTVPVEPGDSVETLAERVFALERELYPEAIRRYMAAHPELRRGPISP